MIAKTRGGGRTPLNPPLENVFKLNNIFSKLGRHLKEIFRKFRNKDKLKRVIIHVVLQLPVVLVNFIKSDGTRFSNHKYVKAMILIISLNFSMVKRHRLQQQRQLTKASLKVYSNFGTLLAFGFYAFSKSVFFIKILNHSCQLSGPVT